MVSALLSVTLLLLLPTTTHSTTLSFVPPPPCYFQPTKSPQQQNQKKRTYTPLLDLYKKFHEYAWEKLHYNDDCVSNVPDSLKANTSPVKGSLDGTNVVVSVRSISEFRRSVDKSSVDTNNHVGSIRLARSAFLETQTNSSEALISPMAIHVLNFVMFPKPYIRDPLKSAFVGIPIFGADIVSLPGNKHLVALDFQPVLPINNEDGSVTNVFPENYAHLEEKLNKIHAKYQKGSSTSEALLPWGGDIPPQALRWFSPYALWTRLNDKNAMQTVSTTVWDAFREYLDLYVELMDVVQCDLSNGKLDVVIEEDRANFQSGNPVLNGQREYLEYRRINDPARPMLRSLFGTAWAEELIDRVLFPSL